MTSLDERVCQQLSEPHTATEIKHLLNGREPTYSEPTVTASLARLSAEGRVTYEDKPHRTLPSGKERFWRSVNGEVL